MGARTMWPSTKVRTLSQVMERRMSLLPCEGIQAGGMGGAERAVVVFSEVVEGGVRTLLFSESDKHAVSVW
jgi:hypothetical protein